MKIVHMCMEFQRSFKLHIFQMSHSCILDPFSIALHIEVNRNTLTNDIWFSICMHDKM